MVVSPPAGWRYAALHELADVVSGGTPSRAVARYWGGSIPWVTPTEVARAGVRYLDSTREAVTEAGARAAGLRILPVDSVLVTTRATIGAVAQARVPVTTNQGFQNLVPHADIDAAWLFHAIEAARPVLLSLAAGSTFKEVSRENFRRLRLLVAPPREQRSIAAVLDAIDDAVERSERTIVASETFRQTLLRELLTYGVPGWHTEWSQASGLGVTPRCWTVARLGDEYDVDLGKMVSPAARSGSTRPYLTNRNVKWGRFDLSDVPRMHFEDDELERYRVRFGDLLVCEGGEVGRAAIWREELADCFYQKALHRLRPRHADEQHPPFLRFLLEHASRRGFLADKAPQTSIAHLTRETLVRTSLPFPGIREEVAIAEAIEIVEARIEAETDALRSMQALYSRVADALLQGTLRTMGETAHRITRV